MSLIFYDEKILLKNWKISFYFLKDFCCPFHKISRCWSFSMQFWIWIGMKICIVCLLLISINIMDQIFLWLVYIWCCNQDHFYVLSRNALALLPIYLKAEETLLDFWWMGAGSLLTWLIGIVFIQIYIYVNHVSSFQENNLK